MKLNKKIITLGAIIVALALISTTGCTSRQETNKSAGGGSQTVGKSNLDVAINSVHESYALGPYSTPTPGNKFELFDVTITNVNAKDKYVGPSYFKLKTADGTVYQYDSHTFSSNIKGFQSVSNTQPGEKVSGVVVFQIPASAKPAVLTYDDYTNRVNITL